MTAATKTTKNEPTLPRLDFGSGQYEMLLGYHLGGEGLAGKVILTPAHPTPIPASCFGLTASVPV